MHKISNELTDAITAYRLAVEEAYVNYLRVKEVMPNGGCGLTDDEDGWLCEYYNRKDNNELVDR